MIVKDDAEQIVDFAFPATLPAGQIQVTLSTPLVIRGDFQTHTLVLCDRIQIVNDFEGGFAVVGPVNASQIER
jgi:hypothetical protein